MITAFIVYSWSILIILYDMPEMILRLSSRDILGFSAYQFVFSFIETIIVTGFVVGLWFILPFKINRESFAISSSLISVALCIVAVIYKALPNILSAINYVSSRVEISRKAQIVAIGIWISLVLIMPILAPFVGRGEKVKSIFEMLFDRLSPLIIFYTLLSIISLPVVLLRNM